MNVGRYATKGCLVLANMSKERRTPRRECYNIDKHNLLEVALTKKMSS